VNVEDEEGITRKRAASLPLRGLSLKCPCTTIDGGQGSLHLAFVNLSLAELEAPAQGEGTEDMARTGVMSRADDKAHRPLEVSGGEDQYLLQRLASL